MGKPAFLATVCIILSTVMVLIPVREARAQQEIGSLEYSNVPRSEYYDASAGQYKPEYYAWKRFFEYNEYREQCQHYQEPPEGYVVKGCHVVRVEQPVAMLSTLQPAAGEAAPAAAPAAAPEKTSEPVTIYFNFDKSYIRDGEKGKIDTIVDEIRAANPGHIIIAGHTDTAGPVDYNLGLSQRRAQIVVDALIAKGIQKDILEQKAYGKTDLAVPTADNVPLQDNRRTVVIFVQ